MVEAMNVLTESLWEDGPAGVDLAQFFCGDSYKITIGGNNRCIPPTLEGWVYIIPIHGPLYTRAQYTPTLNITTLVLQYSLLKPKKEKE